MTELREKMISVVRAHFDWPESENMPDAIVDQLLAIPEIADALKLTPVRELNLGPSISTGTRKDD